MVRQRVLVLVLACTLVGAVRGSAQSGAAGQEQQVLQAEKDRFAAMIKVDEPVLNKLLSDDLVYIHSTALLQTKKEFIGTLKEGAIKYISMTPSAPDLKVRIAGSVAVVTGVAAVHVVDHGTDKNMKIRYTEVHTNRNGSWQLMSWQSTVLP